jgi:hypothetical protein
MLASEQIRSAERPTDLRRDAAIGDRRGVVATWTIGWETSPSHVSVTWTLEPTQLVERLLP